MILFSRMVVFNKRLPMVMAITAIGMEALTVKPAFNARYTFAAPNKQPIMQPVTTAFRVNSFIWVWGDTNGLNAVGSCMLVN